MNERPRTLIVGIGSPHGDDQFGWVVVDLLEGQLPASCEIRRGASPADLLDWLGEWDELILCDACRGWGRPGEVVCWQWEDVPESSVAFAGTHDLGLIAVLTLAQSLGVLPKTVRIWAVEVPELAPARLSRDLTSCVAAAASEVAQQIARAINHQHASLRKVALKHLS